MTNYTAKESVLTYLSDPAVVAALGAFAVTSAYYLYSRPTPQPCPVDANRQSYELPGEDGARMSSLSTEIIERLFDDVTTAHEAFMRGVNLSGDKPCLGFRSSPGGPYAWLTYNEVLERSFNTGSGLVEIGCNPADSGHTFVGVYAPNRIEWVFVGQACNLYSMSLVPLYDTLGPDACVFIVNQAQMTTIVCDESKLKVLLEEAKKCPPLQKVPYFICILYLFYCYHTYFNLILIFLRSILLLFSLIRKIDHLFYCCFTSIETLFYKQWSILSLFYNTKPQNSS